VDEVQRLRGVILESLDREQHATDLARHAYQSRTRFYRVFRAMIEETPVAMRRRLLPERAAWQLSRTQLSVTAIGLNANYGSLEAFTRAEKRTRYHRASIVVWGFHTLTCTRRTEFITIPAFMT
jgi:AraC-like DNA-binding protein